MTDIELFMLDKCSKREAEDHIANGSFACDAEEWDEFHAEIFGMTLEEIKASNGDARYVEDNDGHGYVLVYCL